MFFHGWIDGKCLRIKTRLLFYGWNHKFFFLLAAAAAAASSGAGLDKILRFFRDWYSWSFYVCFISNRWFWSSIDVAQ